MFLFYCLFGIFPVGGIGSADIGRDNARTLFTLRWPGGTGAQRAGGLPGRTTQAVDPVSC